MSRAARTLQERAQDDRLEAYMAAARAGTAKATAWQAPRSALGDFISREVLGIDLDAGTHEETVRREAWSTLTPEQQESVTAEEPEAQEAYAAAVAKVENERESAAFAAMSTKDQLAASGVDVTDPERRAAYGWDQR
jgi:hypothetical protein